MEKKHILIIGLSKGSIGSFQLIRNTQDQFNFSLVTKRNDLIPQYRLFFKNIILVEKDYYAEADTFQNQIINLHKKEPLDGIISLTDETIFLTSLILKQLQKIGPLPQEALVVRNKFLMRDTLAKEKLFNHFYQLISALSDIDKIDNKNFPLAVKPITSSSSILVQKVNNKKELKSYWSHFQKNNPNQISNRLARPFLKREYQNLDLYNSCLVESFLRGEEVSVEGIISNGKIYFAGITDKIVSDPPYFIELGHIFPSQKPAALQKKIFDFVEKSLIATRVNNTGFHVELKINQEKLDIIEIGGRLGGGFIQNLIYFTKGYNSFLALIKTSLGKFSGFTKVNPQTSKLASTYYIIAPREGILQSINTQQLITRFKKNIQMITFYRQPGDKILLPPKQFTNLRLAPVVFTANSMSEISKIIVDFKKMVKVTIV